MFRISWSLLRPIPQPAHAVVRRRRAASAASSADEPDPGSGCGWFDSSWELRHGLKVTEHQDFERLPPEVPLEWLLQ